MKIVSTAVLRAAIPRDQPEGQGLVADEIDHRPNGDGDAVGEALAQPHRISEAFLRREERERQRQDDQRADKIDTHEDDGLLRDRAGRTGKTYVRYSVKPTDMPMR